MPKKSAKNQYKKRKMKKDEPRLKGNELITYLTMANSKDPKDRLEAMENLCPCRLRKRVGAAWNAIYKGLQDSDLRVRKAAWHTLEENHGGQPNSPKLYPLMLEISETELDSKLREKAKSIVRRAQSETQSIKGRSSDLLLKRSNYFQGKCDWCGDRSMTVDYIYNNEFQIGTTVRLAQACAQCRLDHQL